MFVSSACMPIFCTQILMDGQYLLKVSLLFIASYLYLLSIFIQQRVHIRMTRHKRYDRRRDKLILEMPQNLQLVQRSTNVTDKADITSSDGQISNQISVPNHKSNLKSHLQITNHFSPIVKSNHNFSDYKFRNSKSTAWENTLQLDFAKKSIWKLYKTHNLCPVWVSEYC